MAIQKCESFILFTEILSLFPFASPPSLYGPVPNKFLFILKLRNQFIYYSALLKCLLLFFMRGQVLDKTKHILQSVQDQTFIFLLFGIVVVVIPFTLHTYYSHVPTVIYIKFNRKMLYSICEILGCVVLCCFFVIWV